MLLFVIAITLYVGVGTGNHMVIFVVCVHFALEAMTFLPRVLTNNSNWFNDAMKSRKNTATDQPRQYVVRLQLAIRAIELRSRVKGGVLA